MPLLHLGALCEFAVHLPNRSCCFLSIDRQTNLFLLRGFNYALLPSLQQFNKILANEISLMLDDTSNPNVSSEMDALLKRRVLEQLG